MNNLEQQPQSCQTDVRCSYCVCGDKWSVNTNIRPPEDLSVICENCDGYVTIDQVPVDMKFKEQFGNQR